MKKSEMNSLVAGAKLQSKKDSTVYTIVGIDLEQGKVILDNGKLYAMGTIQRWYNLYEEQDTTEQTNTSDLQDTNTQDNEIYEEYVEIPEVVEPDNTILTDIDDADNLELDEDLENTLIQLDCTAIKRKEYLGIYKEGYRDCILMLRNSKSKKGNLHIDMKEKIYVALDEEVRSQIEVLYDTGIYDKTRGYLRIKDCDNLKVLAVVLRTALQLAS